MKGGGESIESRPTSAHELFLLLEHLASGSGVPFDRILAKRVLQETLDAHPGDAQALWGDWIAAAGGRLGLRVTPVRLPLNEILSLLRPNDPIGLYQPEAQPSIWVLLDASLWRVRVWNGDETTLTRNELVQRLGLSSRRDSIDAVLVQPIAPCESAATAGHADAGDDHATPPLRRLWSFFRPESSDIRVVFVFALFVGLFSLATPIAVESLITTVMFGNLLQPLVVLALTLLIFLAGSSAMRATQTVVMEILQRRIFVRVVDDIAFRLPRTPIRAFEDRYAPELINRFLETATLQKLGAFLILDGMTIAIQLVVGMTVLAFYHPWLIGFDVFLLLMLGTVVFLVGRGAVSTAILESRVKYATVAWLEDLARCPTTFRGLGASEFAFDRADQLATDYVARRAAHFRILFRQIVSILGLEALLSAMLLGLGGWLVIQGQMTLGQLVAAELIVTMIVGSTAKLGKHFESFYDLLAGMDKLGHIFDLPMEGNEGRPLPQSTEGIHLEFTEVQAPGWESAGGGRSWNLEIASGECVVLNLGDEDMESLVADAAVGLRRCASGCVSLDGVDVRELSVDSLRSQTALVRDVEVFEGTIEENVHVGRPEVVAAEVHQALRDAGLWEDVRRLPDGLRTQLVRGHGSPLNRSQLRKLMLARALAGKPRLLVVDRCLDSLSSQDLKYVGARLRRRAGCTVILATERPELASMGSRLVSALDDGAPSAGEGERGPLRAEA
jgi:ABC-type bacteriocin/lantibiotic exporter with double-glycine peptidase domain